MKASNKFFIVSTVLGISALIAGYGADNTDAQSIYCSEQCPRCFCQTEAECKDKFPTDCSECECKCDPACGTPCSKNSDCNGAIAGCTTCYKGKCTDGRKCGAECGKDSDCANSKDACTSCNQMTGKCDINACGKPCGDSIDCGGNADGSCAYCNKDITPPMCTEDPGMCVRDCVRNCDECKEQGGCTENKDCRQNEFCKLDDCEGCGKCVKKPLTCDTYKGQEVCSCDGVTYDSLCEANKKGLNIQGYGACDKSPEECVGVTRVNLQNPAATDGTISMVDRLLGETSCMENLLSTWFNDPRVQKIYAANYNLSGNYDDFTLENLESGRIKTQYTTAYYQDAKGCWTNKDGVRFEPNVCVNSDGKITNAQGLIYSKAINCNRRDAAGNLLWSTDEYTAKWNTRAKQLGADGLWYDKNGKVVAGVAGVTDGIVGRWYDKDGNALPIVTKVVDGKTLYFDDQGRQWDGKTTTDCDMADADGNILFSRAEYDAVLAKRVVDKVKSNYTYRTTGVTSETTTGIKQLVDIMFGSTCYAGNGEWGKGDCKPVFDRDKNVWVARTTCDDEDKIKGTYADPCTFYLDKDCKAVDFNGQNLCGDVVINTLGSPVSLVWGDISNVKYGVSNFPLSSKNKGKWVIWRGSKELPLVVYDPKKTGKITSAEQLFGLETFGKEWSDGFEALASLDKNGDGKLSGEELKDLSLWFDSKGDGVSRKGEVVDIRQAGVTELYFKKDGNDVHTADIIASVGFSRTASDGTVTRGAAIDWFAKETFNSKAEAEKALKELSQELSERAEINKSNFTGAWKWVVDEQSINDQFSNVSGILVIHDSGTNVVGESVVQLTLDKNNSNAASQVSIMRFENVKRKVSKSNVQQLEFIIVSDQGNTTASTVELSADGRTMTGVSRATGVGPKGTAVTAHYTWKAVRLDRSI